MKSKDYQGIRILVLDCYGRQTSIILRELHKLGCVITTVNYSKLDIGYSSHYPKRRIVLRSEKNDKEALKNLLDREIFSDNYDVVFPLLELSTEIINENREEYSKHVRIIAAEKESFEIAYDKQLTMECCMKAGIPCPITKKAEEKLDDFVKRLGFPLVLKPRKSSGSIGFHCVKSQDELDNLVDTINLDEYVVQEYIPQTGAQLLAYLMFDRESNVKSCVVAEKVRWYPLDGGTATLMSTILDDAVSDNCIKLLKEIKWTNYAHIDLILDPRDGVEKVMEINGRIPASIKIDTCVGIPFMKQLLDNVYNKDVDSFMSYEAGKRLRHFQADVLCFLKSKNRFKFKPSFFNNFKTKDMVFCFFDPIPFFTYSISHVKSYKKDMKKRSR